MKRILLSIIYFFVVCFFSQNISPKSPKPKHTVKLGVYLVQKLLHKEKAQKPTLNQDTTESQFSYASLKKVAGLDTTKNSGYQVLRKMCTEYLKYHCSPWQEVQFLYKMLEIIKHLNISEAQKTSLKSLIYIQVKKCIVRCKQLTLKKGSEGCSSKKTAIPYSPYHHYIKDSHTKNCPKNEKIKKYTTWQGSIEAADSDQISENLLIENNTGNPTEKYITDYYIFYEDPHHVCGFRPIDDERPSNNDRNNSSSNDRDTSRGSSDRNDSNRNSHNGDRHSCEKPTKTPPGDNFNDSSGYGGNDYSRDNPYDNNLNNSSRNYDASRSTSNTYDRHKWSPPKPPSQISPHYESFQRATQHSDLQRATGQISLIFKLGSLGIGHRTPFIRHTGWWPFKSTQLRLLDIRELFHLPCFDSKKEEEICKKILEAYKNGKGPLSNPQGISFAEASRVRLKLLHQTYLYQHPEFIDFIKRFPEYELYICGLYQFINNRYYVPTILEQVDKNGHAQFKFIDQIKSLAQEVLRKKRQVLTQPYRNFVSQIATNIKVITQKYINELSSTKQSPFARKLKQQLKALEDAAKKPLSGNIFTVLEKTADELRSLGQRRKLSELHTLAQAAAILFDLQGETLEDYDKNPLETYTRLKLLDIHIQNGLSTFLNHYFNPFIEYVNDYKHAQEIAHIFQIEPIKLFNLYESIGNRALLKDVSIILKNLDAEQKILVHGVTNLAQHFEEQNDKKAAQSFLNLLKPENIEEFLNGVGKGIIHQNAPIDLPSFVSCTSSYLQQGGINAIIGTAPPQAQLAFYIVNGIVNAYCNANKLIDDLGQLITALTQANPNQLGFALVNIGYDVLDTYNSAKALKNVSKTVYMQVHNKDRSGSSRSKRNSSNNQKYKERYNKPVVKSMNDFLTNTKFGRLMKEKSVKTNRKFRENRIYKATENIPNTPIKKNDYFYFDPTHNDHIEVYDSNGRPRAVMNLDGSKNESKTKKAEREKRTIKDNIK